MSAYEIDQTARELLGSNINFVDARRFATSVRTVSSSFLQLAYHTLFGDTEKIASTKISASAMPFTQCVVSAKVPYTCRANDPTEENIPLNLTVSVPHKPGESAEEIFARIEKKAIETPKHGACTADATPKPEVKMDLSWDRE